MVLGFGAFEKVKLYKARDFFEMAVARSGGMRPWLSAIAGKALPNDLMVAVSHGRCSGLACSTSGCAAYFLVNAPAGAIQGHEPADLSAQEAGAGGARAP